MKALTLAESMGKGILAIPKTLIEGLIRTEQGLEFWDVDEQVKIGGQNERAFEALGKLRKYGFIGVKSPIFKLVRIILFHYYETLPENVKHKLFDQSQGQGAYLTTKVAGNYFLSQYVAKFVTKNLVDRAVFMQYMVKMEFTLLTVQGILYHAGAASERLKKKFPKIYFELRKEHLDMLYFIVEEPMKKYLNAIRNHKIFPEIYQELAKRSHNR